MTGLGGTRGLGWLEQQIDTRGHANVFFLPLTAFATIGGALLLLGNDWVLLLIVFAVASIVVLTLFWAVEHHRVRHRDAALDALGKQFTTFCQQRETETDQLAKHEGEINTLRGVIENVNWAVQRVATCCISAPTNGHPTAEGNDHRTSPPRLNVDVVRGTVAFARLEEALLDLINDAVPGKRRVALYYGDDARLEPMARRGWVDSEPPVFAREYEPRLHEIDASPLLEAMARSQRAYIANIDSPHDEREEQLAQLVPGGMSYKALACFPMTTFASLSAAERGQCRLIGAVVVQHQTTDALRQPHDREYLSLLANMLATSFVVAAAGVRHHGRCDAV